MQMLIEIGDKNVALVVPAELAEVAARLIASTRVVEKTFTSAALDWVPCDAKLSLTFGDDSLLDPLTPREIAATEAVSKHRHDWYEAYTENNKNKTRVKELEAELATIRSLTSCTTTSPPPPSEPVVPQPEEPFL